VSVQQPRVRDRSGDGAVPIRFSPSILPPYARRTKSLDALIPVLYLRGISSGDFQEALAALLGKDAPNLSPAVLGRLKGRWREEFERWQQRDLSARRYVYIWADGVYLQARMEPEKQCILVLIGATPEGKKELIGFQNGYRESTQSWSELLADLKSRGLSVAPELAIGDGAFGFWKALEQEFGTTRHQRCWQHKAMNVLNKLPKSIQSKAKVDVKEIWMAESREDAEKALDRFLAKYGAKYDKAAECLTKDRKALLAFYDFPAEHWKHIRTGNPIESTFATVRHRTVRTKGCLSLKTAELMVFKLIQAAQASWRRLDGQNQLPKVIEEVKFTDGIETNRDNAAA
jgi:transposase-like protein